MNHPANLRASYAGLLWVVGILIAAIASLFIPLLIFMIAMAICGKTNNVGPAGMLGMLGCFIIGLIANFFVLRWWYNEKSHTLTQRMVYDRRVSNFFIAVTWRIVNILLGIYSNPFFCIPVIGWLGAYYAAGRIFRTNRHFGYINTNYRCEECHGFDNTHFNGSFLDGIKAVHDSDNDVSITTDYEDGGRVQVETTTRTRYHKVKYYQMEADHYTCGECGHRWKVRYRGSFLGQDSTHTKQEKTERQRLAW